MARPLPLLAALALCACNETLLAPPPDLVGMGGDDGGTVMVDGGCGPAPAPMLDVVMTDRGAVRGTAARATWSFKGIPYAAPPTGNLRFRPPVEHACFGEMLDASKFGNSCLQLDANGNVVGDEDCLTLNIWSPVSAPVVPMPVMVFIHGGGNTQGSSSAQASGTFLYDAEPMAPAGPVVVVTINYRLGVMGFFALPALDAESDHHVSGNYGLLDQVAALQWVQRNIRGFGGDPNNVTIFGESAGAVNVCMQMVSPLSTGLFTRALMESGGCPAPTLAATEMQDVALLPMVGCDAAPDVAACMRALPGPMLTRQLPGVVSVSGLDRGGTKYGPNVDGWVLPAAPMQMLRAGMHHHVPFAIGSNSDETSQSVPNTITTEMIYANAIHMVFGQVLGDQVLALYPASDFRSPRAAMVAVTTDARFVCPSRQIARAVAANQSERVYRYFFTHALDNSPMLRPLGAWHGLELLFVFNHLNVGGYAPSAGEMGLAENMIRYWTSFAVTGDPNGKVATRWPAYDVATDPYIALDNTIAVGAGVRTAKCDFWDKLSP